MSTPLLIDSSGLTRRFGALTAVDGIDLQVEAGEIYGLVGPDGAGKTTTLRMLAAILEPDAGSARVAGCDTLQDPAGVKEHTAYMSQRFGLYSDLTVKENIDFYADLYGVARRARSRRLDELLGFTGLRPFVKRRSGQLSGGMKQKLQLMCALIHTPRVLLLDEPTNGVDPISRRDFWQILYRLLEQGVAILTTTAYLDEAERCHRVGLLHRGRMLAQGTPLSIKETLRGKILSIDTAQARRAAPILRRALGSAHLFGNSIHIACPDGAKAAAVAAAALSAAGIPMDGAQIIEPSLEDIFVHLVSPEASEAAGALAPAGNRPAGEGDRPAVVIQDLTRRFGDFTAVDRLSLTVASSEIFGFLGPNGAGKSTTIRMLCGLLRPSAGGGAVGGFDLVAQPEEIKRHIGYMSQKFSLYDDLRVEENLVFYGSIYGLTSSRLRERIDWALSMAGLTEHRRTLTGILSGGWKQRLALACAVLHEPPILFLDEPTSGVDPLSRRRFWDLIYAMADQGITVFVTTHYMEEAEYCGRLALIDDGRLIALGTPDELKAGLASETLLEVTGEQLQNALTTIRELPEIHEVTLFGNSLHVRTSSPEAAGKAIRGSLARNAIPLKGIRAIAPNMEDVFVALVRRRPYREDQV